MKETTRKEQEVAVFFDQPFLVFGANMDIYIANLHIQSEYGQMQTKRNSDFRSFPHSKTQGKMTSQKNVYQISFHSEICMKSNFFLALSVKTDHAYWKAKRRYKNQTINMNEKLRKKTQITLRSQAFTTQSRRSHLEVFCKKTLCGQYRKIQRKTLVLASLLFAESLLNLRNLCLSYLTFHISYFINLALLPAFVSFDSCNLKL